MARNHSKILGNGSKVINTSIKGRNKEEKNKENIEEKERKSGNQKSIHYNL